MPKRIVWVLVADSQHCRLLEQQTSHSPWQELGDEKQTAVNPRSHEQGTERPGRVYESVGSARHAISPRHDLHEAGKTAFAERLCEKLEEAANAGRYQRLVVVSPPAFLGRIRAALGDAARDRLCGTLSLDLSHATIPDIVRHLLELKPA